MGKPELPSGLYISVSQLKTHLACPRKFALKYILGVAPAFVPVPLAFGSAFHEALAAHYQELKATGQALEEDLVLDVFRTAWERESSGPIPLQAGDDEDSDLGHIVDKGISMLRVFCECVAARETGLIVEAVEKPFQVEIHDPDTGEVLDEALVGIIDLLAGNEDGYVVVEHKTSSRRYTRDQLDFDLQPTCYKLAARQMGFGDVGLRFQICIKTKNPQVQIAEIERAERDEDDLLRTVQGILRAIEAGVSYPIRGWACQSCPFAYACTGASS